MTHRQWVTVAVACLLIGLGLGFALGRARREKYRYDHVHGFPLRTNLDTEKTEVFTPKGWEER